MEMYYTTMDRGMKYKIIIYEVAVRKYGSNYPHFDAFSIVKITTLVLRDIIQTPSPHPRVS